VATTPTFAISQQVKDSTIMSADIPNFFNTCEFSSVQMVVLCAMVKFALDRTNAIYTARMTLFARGRLMDASDVVSDSLLIFEI